MQEVPVTVTICERPYRLMVNPDDEPLLREAAKRINERVKVYAKNYAFRDQQDLLSMVSLQYTLSALKNEQSIAYRDKDLLERLRELDKTLSVQEKTA